MMSRWIGVVGIAKTLAVLAMFGAMPTLGVSWARADSVDPNYILVVPSGVTWPLAATQFNGSNQLVGSGTFGGFNGTINISNLAAGTFISTGVYSFNQSQLETALSGTVNFTNNNDTTNQTNGDPSNPFNVSFNASYPNSSANSSNTFPTLTGLLFVTTQGIFLGPNSSLAMGGLETSPRNTFDSLQWVNGTVSGQTPNSLTLHRDTSPGTGTFTGLSNTNWPTQTFSSTTAWEIAAIVPEPSRVAGLLGLGIMGAVGLSFARFAKRKAVSR